MSNESPTSNELTAMQLLHPFCNTCGWRKGGIDSWDGRACKCGHYEPAFPLYREAAVAIGMTPSKSNRHADHEKSDDDRLV